MSPLPTKKAFTLIEIIFAVAVLGALSAMGISAIREFGRAHALSSAAEAIVSALSEAKAKTLASDGGQRFGVHFDSEQAYVFVDTYVVGASTNRSVLPTTGQVLLGPVNISGGNDVVFKKITGETDNYGTITLTYPGTTASTTVIIERTGNITLDE